MLDEGEIVFLSVLNYFLNGTKDLIYGIVYLILLLVFFEVGFFLFWRGLVVWLQPSCHFPGLVSTWMTGKE